MKSGTKKKKKKKKSLPREAAEGTAVNLRKVGHGQRRKERKKSLPREARKGAVNLRAVEKKSRKKKKKRKNNKRWLFVLPREAAEALAVNPLVERAHGERFVTKRKMKVEKMLRRRKR